MYRNDEARFYLRNKARAVAGFSDVESFAGIKHTVLVNWVYRDLLPLNAEKNGKGCPIMFTIGDCCKLYVAGMLYRYGFRVPVIVKLCLSVAKHLNDYSLELAGIIQHARPEHKFLSFWYDSAKKIYVGVRAGGRVPVIDGAVQLAFDLEELGNTMIGFMGNYDFKN